MESLSSPREFSMQIDVDAPPEAVWQALADDVGLRRWFAPQASVTPGVGGTVEWQWGELHRWPQEIEVWQPGARLRTRYTSSLESGAQPLFVDFLLEGDGGRTTLRLVHSGFGPDATFDEEFDGISRGWPVELGALKVYLEHHLGRERKLVWSTADLNVDPAEGWRRLTAEGAFACGAELDQLEAGAPFSFTTAAGDVFEGEALRCHKREFSGIVRNRDNAFLRFTVESCGGVDRAWLALSTYGWDDAQVAAQQQRWDALLAQLFAGAPANAGDAG